MVLSMGPSDCNASGLQVYEPENVEEETWTAAVCHKSTALTNHRACRSEETSWLRLLPQSSRRLVIDALQADRSMLANENVKS